MYDLQYRKPYPDSNIWMNVASVGMIYSTAVRAIQSITTRSDIGSVVYIYMLYLNYFLI